MDIVGEKWYNTSMGNRGPKPDTKTDRRIVKLKDTYGWSFRAIAGELGRNIKTVYDRYKRAKGVGKLST